MHGASVGQTRKTQFKIYWDVGGYEFCNFLNKLHVYLDKRKRQVLAFRFNSLPLFNLSLGITYHADDEEKYLGQNRRKKYDLRMQIIYFSIYTLSDLGDLSNLIGSLSRTITGNIGIYQISE